MGSMGLYSWVFGAALELWCWSNTCSAGDKTVVGHKLGKKLSPLWHQWVFKEDTKINRDTNIKWVNCTA